MINNSLVVSLSDLNIEVYAHKSLAEYTSFKIGGEADYLVMPHTCEDVINTVKLAIAYGVDYYFLGNGSNILVSDNGYRGMVILTSGFDEITLFEGDKIVCSCGATVAKLCMFAYQNSLSGLEFAWGIPGSVGGGVYMNAGAYGGEFKDCLRLCKYIDECGNTREISIQDMDMSYRHSFFTDKKLFILSAVFELKKDDSVDIKARMDDFLSRRKSKQPLEYPSCGSTFKRPKNGYASVLIQECGLKGYKIGGAQVSEKHSGFIINSKEATCRDVLALIEYVKRVVYEKKGIELECEVKTLGVKN